MKPTLLVIEDDALLNRVMSENLREMGYAVHGAQSWAEARAYLAREPAKLVLIDVQLPDADGLDLLGELVREQPVIVLTAYGSVRDAVRAMKNGAAEYLVKPINPDEMELTVRRVLESSAQRQDLQFCRRSLMSRNRSGMVGESRALQEVRELIEAVAPSDMTVLIQGESGVGKELVAQSIHERSGRSRRNFVAVDCCTLQERLFESELFGHEKGAFTGADRQKKGLIEGAEGGTLFLDEIGEIEPPIQAKLLRVLETGRFRRLGGTRDLSANVRVVAASNRDLARMSRDGRFRADLYYRLGAFTLRVPPLRERREDIPLLVENIIRNHDFSRRIDKHLTPRAMRALTAYDWPGNVRELKNVIERAIILSRDRAEIGSDLFALAEPATAAATGTTEALDLAGEPTLEDLQRQYVVKAMERHAGHRATVAKRLGISERNLYRLIKRYGLR